MLFALIFTSVTVGAQVQKGDSNIGTNLGIISQKGDEPLLSYSTTYLSLNYQYYISNKVSLGIAPAWNVSKVLDGAFAVRSRSLNFFMDYNFLSANGKVMPYIGVKYTTMLTKVEFEDLAAGIGVLGGATDDILDPGTIPGGGGITLPEGEFILEYRRSIFSLSTGIKFFVTERLNIDNNLTIGTVLNETVEAEFFGTSADLGTDDPGRLIQFTIGFGYIIGKRGS